MYLTEKMSWEYYYHLKMQPKLNIIKKMNAAYGKKSQISVWSNKYTLYQSIK